MSETVSEQIETLRGEAAQARHLAAAVADKQAVADLILYAEALEAEVAQLLEAHGAAEPGAVPLPAETSYAVRRAGTHA